ncbi:hypothetical protein [Microcoleus sp. D2_18a_D3]|uniref:hypothetical protein n=1 Tax=Microcoleus sp. D2_18a_D3 TaxID=3055330 RepID=UPI002FD3B0C9
MSYRFRLHRNHKIESTVNSQHSTLNTQHSTLNTQHSTVNSQQSTVNSQQSTIIPVLPEFVAKSEISPETEFLAPGLGLAPRRRASVVMYNTGQVKTVARKNAVNSPGAQKR